MKITGQILKENRERKGISLSEVAIATKINLRTLQAMESGDTSNLPPKTFLRGFVRAYSTYLELDVESVLNNFYEEMGSTKPKAIIESAPAATNGTSSRAKPSPQEAHEAINPKASLAVKIGAVAGILVLIILIVTIKDKMESYQKETVIEPPGEISSLEKLDGKPDQLAIPPDAPTQGGVAALPSATASSSPSPQPSPHSSPVATPVASPSPSPSPKTTPSPSPTPSATPKPSPSPQPTVAPTPVSTPAAVVPVSTPASTPASTPTRASPTPTATPKATPAGRPQEVIIEALDAVDIDAQIDEEAVRRFKLKGDQVQTIKAKRRVVLKFTDGGAVNLIVNGIERGVPGDLGKPMRIELP